jgi:hypothetical protein
VWPNDHFESSSELEMIAESASEFELERTVVKNGKVSRPVKRQTNPTNMFV